MILFWHADLGDGKGSIITLQAELEKGQGFHREIQVNRFGGLHQTRQANRNEEALLGAVVSLWGASSILPQH